MGSPRVCNTFSWFFSAHTRRVNGNVKSKDVRSFAPLGSCYNFSLLFVASCAPRANKTNPHFSDWKRCALCLLFWRCFLSFALFRIAEHLESIIYIAIAFCARDFCAVNYASLMALLYRARSPDPFELSEWKTLKIIFFAKNVLKLKLLLDGARNTREAFESFNI